MKQLLRWPVVIVLLWAALAARMAIAAIGHEPLRSDTVSLPLIGFIVTSAILGGRVWQRMTVR